MAGDWIKLEKNIFEKPEVWAMAGALETDPDLVVSKLLKVWIWFDDQSLDGHAPSVTKNLLDAKAGVTGLCNAMIDVGWMVEEEQQISLPNFDRHNGATAKKRAQSTARKQKQRAQDGHADDVTKTGPEKRREEKNNSNKTIAKKLPSDFALSKAQESRAVDYWQERNRPDLSTKDQFTKFYSHHRAKGSRMVDWDAAWTTWYTRAIEYTKPPARKSSDEGGFADKHTDQSWREGLQ